MRILVKIGGAQLEEPGPRQALCQAVARACEAGHELIVVHGGGNQIRTLGRALGIEDRYHEGLRITDARAFQSRVLDQPAGRILRGISEDAAGARQCQRLGVLAILQIIFHGFLDGDPFARLQLKPDPDQDPPRQLGMSILEDNVRRVDVRHIALRRDQANGLDRFFHLSQSGPGIHHQTAGDRARDAGSPFQSGQAPPHRIAD